MTTQPEALRLADALIAATVQTDAEDDVIHVARWFVEDAAAELCRLYAQRDALLEALKMIAGTAQCVDNLMSDKDIARAAIIRARSKE